MNKNAGKLLCYVGIPVVMLAIALRFALFYFRSDGFSGMSLLFPLLAGVDGIWFSVAGAELLAAVFSAVFFVKKRNEYHYA